MRLYALCSIYVVSYFLAALLLLQCEEGKDTRRKFKWFGTINGKEGEYIINCDNECVSCTATVVGGQDEVLPQGHEVYKRCKHLPKSKYLDDVIDTVTVFLIEYKEADSTDNMYGFDSWHKKDGSSFSDKQRFSQRSK